MGAGGIGALAFIGFALIAFFALSILGVSLMVIGSRQKTRDGSTGIFWTGTAIVGVVVTLIVGVVVLGAIRADPGTVRFDLREPITAASLDKDPESGFAGNYYSYDSHHVEITLPDGALIQTDVDRISVFTKDGLVTRINVDGEQALWGDAATTVRNWAKDLHTEVTPPASSEDTWEQKVDIDDVRVDFELRPIKRDTGLEARPSLEFIPPDR